MNRALPEPRDVFLRSLLDVRLKQWALGVLLVFACARTLKAQHSARDGEQPQSQRPLSAAHLADPASVRARLGLLPEYETVRRVESVKVAVLDYGFDGARSGRPYLPRSAEVVEHYDPDFVRRYGLGDPDYRKELEPLNRHGRVMAQIVWAVTGSHPRGPKFYLLNANGPTLLRRAVRFAIERKVDIILFSGTFEGGGNGDGRGPIDRIVGDALAAGILWVNAAGNQGRFVYHAPVRVLRDGYLRLRNTGDIASVRFRNRLDENAITITLTWNDYREEEDAGTDKDLDLFVEDWAGRPVGSSTKTQASGDQPAGPEESRNPRERVVLSDLAAGPEIASDPEYTYRIRVRAKRGAFTANDRIRIHLSARRDLYIPPGKDAPEPAVEFIDAQGDEEIYPPADHPLVLTVGDADPTSSLGPTADRRVKPDTLLENSRADFTDGEISAGSSNAAAYLAGVVTVLRAVEPGLRPSHLLRLAQQGSLLPQAGTGARGSSAAMASARGTTSGTTFPRQTSVNDPSRSRPAPSGARQIGSGSSRWTNVPSSLISHLRVWRTPTRSQLSVLVQDRNARR